MNPLVQLRGVGRRYPHFELAAIDLDLAEGCVMGFVGPNGAGKTTTLRILMGMVRPDRGEIQVLGQALPGGLVEAKRDIGFFADDLRLFGSASLQWHMDFVRRIYPAWDAASADQLLHRFGLHREQKVRGLSHGERVKAALLLVLARRPRLLILDEPTTGLDPVARHEVLDALMEVVADEQRSILFSSHHTADVERISDVITFIDRGRILESSDKEDYLERWRRVRVEVPEGVTLPEVEGTARVEQNGRLAVVTAHRFSADLTAAYQRAGATVRSVERLNLEEIFVAQVQRSRRTS